REVANRVLANMLEKTATPRLKELDQKIEVMMTNHRVTMSQQERDLRADRIKRVSVHLSALV
ncbi:hypothetical protein, partial [Gluconobacter cerinus]